MASSLKLQGGRSLAYRLSESDSSSAPVVLLANSLLCDSTSWDHIVPHLTPRFRVLRYDQPGHGHSSAPSDPSTTTFESLADDVHKLLEHLNISKLLAWVGVSMGAATGAIFAAKYAGVVKKLVLCDTISSSPGNAGVTDLFGPRIEAARKEGNVNEQVEQTLQRWFGEEWLAKNPEEASRLRELMRQTSVDGYAACIAALRHDSFDLRPIATKIAMGVEEVLVVVGEKDANLPESMTALRDLIRMAMKKEIEVKIIKGAGHVCYIDGKEEWLEVVGGFL